MLVRLRGPARGAYAGGRFWSGRAVWRAGVRARPAYVADTRRTFGVTFHYIPRKDGMVWSGDAPSHQTAKGSRSRAATGTPSVCGRDASARAPADCPTARFGKRPSVRWLAPSLPEKRPDWVCDRPRASRQPRSAANPLRLGGITYIKNEFISKTPPNGRENLAVTRVFAPVGRGVGSGISNMPPNRGQFWQRQREGQRRRREGQRRRREGPRGRREGPCTPGAATAPRRAGRRRAPPRRPRGWPRPWPAARSGAPPRARAPPQTAARSRGRRQAPRWWTWAHRARAR